MTERVQEAIDIFLDAINEGVLAKGSCAMCAVGNLVAHGMGVKLDADAIRKFDYTGDHAGYCGVEAWRALFCTLRNGHRFPGAHKSHFLYAAAMDNVKSTKFNVKELSKIEHAFEANTKICLDEYSLYSKEEIRTDQINGLKAVIEVMMGFDKCKEDVREVFTKKAELIPV